MVLGSLSFPITSDLSPLCDLVSERTTAQRNYIQSGNLNSSELSSNKSSTISGYGYFARIQKKRRG